MATRVKPSRPYRSQVRIDQARRTRERIINAARDLFVEGGYSGVSISAIARAAGVAPETVYDVFGTKRTLLEGVVAATITGGIDRPADLLETAWVVNLKALPHLADRVGGFAEHTAETLERMAPIHSLIRVAAAADPTVTDLPAQIHDGRFRRQREVLAALSTLKRRERLAVAADTFSALASPELHHILRKVRGWPAGRYARWLRATAVAAVLPLLAGGQAPPGLTR